MKYVDKENVDALSLEEMTPKDNLPFSIFSEILINGKLCRDRAMVDFKKNDLTVQLDIIQLCRHNRPELAIQVPLYLCQKFDEPIWIDIQWNPNTADGGGWEKVVAYNKDMKRIENLGTANIFKRDYTPKAKINSHNAKANMMSL